MYNQSVLQLEGVNFMPSSLRSTTLLLHFNAEKTFGYVQGWAWYCVSLFPFFFFFFVPVAVTHLSAGCLNPHWLSYQLKKTLKKKFEVLSLNDLRHWSLQHVQGTLTQHVDAYFKLKALCLDISGGTERKPPCSSPSNHFEVSRSL